MSEAIETSAGDTARSGPAKDPRESGDPKSSESRRIGPFVVGRSICAGPGAHIYEATDADGARRLLQVVRLAAPSEAVGLEARAEQERRIARRTADLLGQPGFVLHAHGGADGADGSRLLFWALPFTRAVPLAHDLRVRDVGGLLKLARSIATLLADRHSDGQVEPLLSEHHVAIDEHGTPRILGVPIDVSDAWLASDAPGPRRAPEEVGAAPTQSGDVWRLGKLLKVASDGVEVPADVARVLESLVRADPDRRPATGAEVLGDLDGLLASAPGLMGVSEAPDPALFPAEQVTQSTAALGENLRGVATDPLAVTTWGAPVWTEIEANVLPMTPGMIPGIDDPDAPTRAETAQAPGGLQLTDSEAPSAVTDWQTDPHAEVTGRPEPVTDEASSNAPKSDAADPMDVLPVAEALTAQIAPVAPPIVAVAVVDPKDAVLEALDAAEPTDAAASPAEEARTEGPDLEATESVIAPQPEPQASELAKTGPIEAEPVTPPDADPAAPESLEAAPEPTEDPLSVAAKPSEAAVAAGELEPETNGNGEAASEVAAQVSVEPAAADPAAESALEPESEDAAAPAVEEDPEPAAEDVEPAAESALEPESGVAADPEPAAEAVEPAAEVVDPAAEVVEPAVEEDPKPAAEAAEVVEPAVEVAAEPAAEAVEPAAEVAAEPAAEVAAEPAVEVAAEPAVEEDPAPSAEGEPALASQAEAGAEAPAASDSAPELVSGEASEASPTEASKPHDGPAASEPAGSDGATTLTDEDAVASAVAVRGTSATDKSAPVTQAMAAGWNQPVLPSGESPWSEVVSARGAHRRDDEAFNGFEDEIPDDSALSSPPAVVSSTPAPSTYDAGEEAEFAAAISGFDTKKVAGGALAVLIILGFFTLIARTGAQPEAVQVDVVPPTNDFTLDSKPSGALVVSAADGRVLGKTPMAFLVPPAVSARLFLVADGHEPLALELLERGGLEARLQRVPSKPCTVTVHAAHGVTIEGVGNQVAALGKVEVSGAVVVRAKSGQAWTGARLVRCPDRGGQAVKQLKFNPRRHPTSVQLTEPAGAVAYVDGGPVGRVPTRTVTEQAFVEVRVDDASGMSESRWIPTRGPIEIRMPTPQPRRRPRLVVPDTRPGDADVGVLVANDPASAEPKLTSSQARHASRLKSSGERHLKAGRIRRASRSFRECLKLLPNDAICHRGLGHLYRRIGKTKKARIYYRRYLELSPKARDAKRIRGYLKPS